jgi:hypothetical protein
MLRRPQAGTFEAQLQTVKVSTGDMWRLSRHPASEPWWSTNASCRFDDVAGAAGAARFGVLYVGHTPDVAFAESIIHENSLFVAKSGRFEVAKADLHGRSLVSFRHPTRKRLNLVDLTGDALKKLGLNNDISAGARYRIPQLWSTAIHAARVDADGIRFRSRQLNSAYCYAIYDRSGLDTEDVEAIPDELADRLCARFNVTPV